MIWARVGGALMAIAVLLGAFGAHALKARLSAPAMDIYKTAIFYHMVHALGLFIVAWLIRVGPNPRLNASAWLFVAGIALFSGSLYLLAVTGVKWLGAITPLGGLCFIGGWAMIAFSKFNS